jgi:hypothetical protein
MRTILVSSLFIVLGAGLAQGGLILTSADIAGAAGSTVGWGFTLTPDPTEWLSAVSSEALFETNPGLGIYSDLIGNQGGPTSGVIAPGTPWAQTFDAANGLGVGSFTIDPSAHAGDSDSGTIEVLFQTFFDNPNNCPSCSTGIQTFDLPFSVVVQAAPSNAPEPGTLVLGMAALLIAACWKRVR